MGVNVEAWIAREGNLADLLALPAKLASRVPPGAFEIFPEHPDARRAWEFAVEPTPETVVEHCCRLDGPGPIALCPTPHILKIWSHARWLGYLDQADLRERVRGAFRRIARVLGAGEVLWVPDVAVNVVAVNATLEEARRTLTREWGLPNDDSSPQLHRWFDEAV